MVGPFRSTPLMAGLFCAMLLTPHARAEDPPAEASAARQKIEEAIAKARGGSPPLPPAPAPADPAASAPASARTPPEKLPPDLEAARFAAEAASRQLEAKRRSEKSPAEALEMLDALSADLGRHEMPADAREKIARRIERTKREIEEATGKRRGELALEKRNTEIEKDIERRQAAGAAREERLAMLIEEYNDLMDARRFAEAETVAKRAAKLAPDNPVVKQLLAQSQVIRRIETQRSIAGEKQAAFLDVAEDAEKSSGPFVGPIEYPQMKDWADLTKNRSRLRADGRSRSSPAEAVILKKLSTPVTLSHGKPAPLSAVLDDLAKQAGIPIHLDPAGLEKAGVRSDTTVTLTIDQPISLKSALKLVLEQHALDAIVRDEVLKVTAPELMKGDYISRSYPVADLVIAVPNFSSDGLGITGALRDGYSRLSGSPTVSVQPGGPQVGVNGISANGGDGSVNPQALAQVRGGGPAAGSTPSIPFGPPTVGGGQADFASLIELIQNTVAPQTWNTVGGQGAIQEFRTNLSIVVSQTQEVHEEIADLLEQLRRLQDLQVTIEVRFISLNDTFFERIGVDFDFNIQTNTGEPLNMTAIPTQGNGSTSPYALGLAPQPGSRSQTIGLDNSGNPGVTLAPQQGGVIADPNNPNAVLPQRNFFSIPFRQNSYGGATVPQLPGLPDPTTTAANFGFAILSDIEAYFLIQAAQGNTRSNIMQAPKVTLFNGQNAFVSDTRQRPFVTSVVPVVGDFAAAQQPVITVLSEGTAVNVQAVVSSDRRFVRLTLVPFFSSIGKVQEFQFEGTRSSKSKSSDEKSGVDGDAAVQGTGLGAGLTTGLRNEREQEFRSSGTTIQLPEFLFTTVTTTVSVPDGGTVLLGGIKRQREGRNEFGVPILSKVPYINRLFKNVGLGRTTDSLMLMVTPRIIIQEEEEQRLLGNESP